MKHVEHTIKNLSELKNLLNHLDETTSKVPGVTFKDIYFPRGKEEFVLVMDCTTEDRYLEWRGICPPPPGGKDWHEVFFTKDEYFLK